MIGREEFMKKGLTFNIQRARGTGTEHLTEADKADKEHFEAQFADCKTYADLRNKLARMASKQGGKADTQEEDQDQLATDANQEIFGTPDGKNLGARKKTTFAHEEYEELRRSQLTTEEGEEQMPKWFAAASVGLVGRILDAVDQKLDRAVNQKLDQRLQDDKSTKRPDKETFFFGNWNEDEAENEEMDPEDDAVYRTSDEEDETLLLNFERDRLLERYKRRRQRATAKGMPEERKKSALPEKKVEHTAHVSRHGICDFEKAQIAVAKVTDDDFVQHLMERAKVSWMKDPDYWGPAPFTGYGDNFRTEKREPPILQHDATGLQFDQWFKDWRLYITAASGGVHPLAMNAFLIDHVEKSCTVETWQWVNQNHKDADASTILRALKSRVFSRTNMAGTFLDILQKRQTPQQELSALIAENDAMIVHFERAYDDTKEALGILLLMARCKSSFIRTKVAQMQDKPYSDICKTVISLERQHAESLRVGNKVDTEAKEVDGSVNFTNARGRGGPRGSRRGRGGFRGFGNRQGQQPDQSQGRSQSRGRSKSRSARPGGQKLVIQNCNFCGRDHDKGNCPAFGKTCDKCQGVNHFASKCGKSSTQPEGNKQDRGRSTNTRNGPNSKSVEASHMETTSMIEAMESSATPEANVHEGPLPITKKVSANNTIQPLELMDITIATPSGITLDVKALPDTGANVNLMPKHVAKRFDVKPSVIGSPRCANGSALKIEGQTITDVIFDTTLLVDVVWQVAEGPKCVLSKALLIDMGLIPKEFPFQSPTISQSETDVNSARIIKICDDEEVNAIASKYPSVFDGKVTPMKCTPAKIELLPTAVPTSAGHYRTISDAYLEPLKREIEGQVADGILEKLDQKPDAAKYWLHPIVVVPKKGTENVRLTVDFKKLNKHCIRPVNPQKTPLETVRSLPRGEMFFFVADALKGYHQIALEEESKLMTAFYTPFGIYMYRSLPMGYAGSQDIFTDRFGKAVDDLVAARVTEDCLITASDRQAFLKKIDRFFARCQESGITLNPKKTQVGSEVIFGGFKLNKDGYSLDPTLHDSIRKFPPPTTLTELRSFMGLVNQTTSFTDQIAGLAAPLKDLLKIKNEFVWTASHQEAFEKAREELAHPRQLAYFDHRKPTRLYTDASRLNGLGFVVKQLQDEGHWKIVQAGSRFLSSAETRYAMVELELLAIAWAMHKARPFLEGIKFEVMTDHKPLIPICNDYALSDIENKRLQRLKMKLSGFQFEAHWVQGKDNIEADALSRAPVHQPTPEDEIDERDQDEQLKTSCTAIATLNAVEINNAWEPFTEHIDFEVYLVDKMVEEVRDAAEKDEDYKLVKLWLHANHPPSRESIPVRLDPYYREIERLSIDENGLLCHDDKLVIPTPLRHRFIEHLNHLHASPDKMLSRARKSIWWPFMASEIRQQWRSCPTCVERSPSKPAEPTKPREMTNYPFQVVHMDIGTYGGCQWLIIVDQFSGWPLVRNLRKDTTSGSLKKELTKLFTDYGLPETIYSDGGPQFASDEFAKFLEKWKVSHTMSSPHYPQSNGIAENAVKAMKKLLHCCFDASKGAINEEEWAKAVMIYKNTPKKGSKLAPSEILFGHLIRDGITSPIAMYRPQHRAAVKRRQEEVRRYVKQHDKLRRSKPKPGDNIRIGDRVYIQDQGSKRWDRKGEVIEFGRNEREFLVKTDRGASLIRNRHFLKLANPYRKQKAAQPQEPTQADAPSAPTPRETKRGPGRPHGPRNNESTEPIRRSTRVSKPPVRFAS